MTPAPCCPDHHTRTTAGRPQTLACCDPDDCAPCCPSCPTCPTVRLTAEIVELRAMVLRVDPWAFDTKPAA